MFCADICYFSYYMATLPDTPGVRHLFRVSPGNQSVCLTCPGQQREGREGCAVPQDCQYSRVSVSPDQSAYLQHCLGPHIPSSHVFSLPDNACVRTLETNQHLRSAQQHKHLRTREINWSSTENKAGGICHFASWNRIAITGTLSCHSHYSYQSGNSVLQFAFFSLNFAGNIKR